MVLGVEQYHHVNVRYNNLLYYKQLHYVFTWLVVDCGDLPVPPFKPGGLSLTVSNTVYNSTAQYSCTQVGYELIGNSQRVCTSNGTWGGTTPYCQCMYYQCTYMLLSGY